MTTRIVELRRGILKKNDELAAQLRQRYADAGVLVLNLVSSPGTGKTAFLERTLTELRQRGLRVAALVGDLETDNDARRLAASGAPVRQINTHGICHLDAEMIGKHLDAWGETGTEGRGTRDEERVDQGLRDAGTQGLETEGRETRDGERVHEGLRGAGTQGLKGAGVKLDALDILFIENVGNLVCPSSYDLGEKIRVALLSVTEGEDKPLKYPTMFNSADVAVITKIDIAEPCGFNRQAALDSLNQIRPGIRVFESSSKTGAGMEEWLEFLQQQVR